MKSGLSVDEARAKCSSGRVVNTPLVRNEIKSNVMACVAPKPFWNGFTCVDKLRKKSIVE
jgi:hypothetical protein